MQSYSEHISFPLANRVQIYAIQASQSCIDSNYVELKIANCSDSKLEIQNLLKETIITFDCFPDRILICGGNGIEGREANNRTNFLSMTRQGCGSDILPEALWPKLLWTRAALAIRRFMLSPHLHWNPFQPPNMSKSYNVSKLTVHNLLRSLINVCNLIHASFWYLVSSLAFSLPIDSGVNFWPHPKQIIIKILRRISISWLQESLCYQ